MNPPLYPTPDEIRGQGRKVSIRDIQHATCAHYKIGRVDMLSKSRMAHLVQARHVAMFLARKVTSGSWHKIGRAFDRDHTVPIHAVYKIEAQLDAGSRSTRESLAAIKAELDEDAERRRAAAMREVRA